MPPLTLKSYQQAALDSLAAFGEVPYVCLCSPTEDGKPLMDAQLNALFA